MKSSIEDKRPSEAGATVGREKPKEEEERLAYGVEVEARGGILGSFTFHFIL